MERYSTKVLAQKDKESKNKAQKVVNEIFLRNYRPKVDEFIKKTLLEKLK